MAVGVEKFSRSSVCRRAAVLIFVITGTGKQPFNRLIRAIDWVAEFSESDFLVQSGYSTYVPRHCKHFPFCKNETFLSYIKASELIISHPGFGSIGHCIKHNKPMILVPREQKYGEVGHDQHELAEYLADQNDAILCLRDMKLLPEAIEEIKYSSPKYDYHTKIPVLIDDFVQRNFQ